LRQIVFGLEKDTKGDEIDGKINFQLYERAKKADDYGDALVSLDVEVDSKLNSKAGALRRICSTAPTKVLGAPGSSPTT